MLNLLLTRVAVRRPLIAVAAVWILTISTGAAEMQTDKRSDEESIRATVESYVAAYNRGDAKAVAAHWSDSGEWISPSGQAVRGETGHREGNAVHCSTRTKECRIEVVNPSIRMVSPDVAIEEGTVRVIHPSEPPSESTYLAVDVKERGQWKLNTVRETEVPSPGRKFATRRNWPGWSAIGLTTVPTWTTRQP